MQISTRNQREPPTHAQLGKLHLRHLAPGISSLCTGPDSVIAEDGHHVVMPCRTVGPRETEPLQTP